MSVRTIVGRSVYTSVFQLTVLLKLRFRNLSTDGEFFVSRLSTPFSDGERYSHRNGRHTVTPGYLFAELVYAYLCRRRVPLSLFHAVVPVAVGFVVGQYFFFIPLLYHND